MKKGLLKRLKTDPQPVPESEKFIDLGDIDIEGLDLEGGAAGLQLRVAEVNTFEDLGPVVDEVYDGNLVLVDISALSTDDTAMRRVANELKSVARDVNGDVAGVGKNMLAVTPTGVFINRDVIRGAY
ncbi:MAG: cell division protein SepF [Thermoplasmata archaeon]|nr:MAG: cell division protein SepF [Thermoplasmata archaeon]